MRASRFLVEPLNEVEDRCLRETDANILEPKSVHERQMIRTSQEDYTQLIVSMVVCAHVHIEVLLKTLNAVTWAGRSHRATTVPMHQAHGSGYSGKCHNNEAPSHPLPFELQEIA